MKHDNKSIIALLIISCIALFAGCSRNGSGGQIGKPYDPDIDPAVVIDGKSYSIKDDSAELLAALPSEFSYSEALSCMTDGYDKTYDYGYIKVETVPEGEGDRLSCITVTGEGMNTPRGIGIGSSKGDVIKAYGESGYKEGSYLVYSESGDAKDLSGTKLYFKLENDAVTEIILFDPGF